MQGSKEDKYKEQTFGSMGEGKGGMIWGNSIETCTLPHVEQMTGASLMHETRDPKTVLWGSPQG